MNILIFIIILLVLVVVHESGHFFAAKFFGIRVDEFGFGFPPRLLGHRRGETLYSLNLLPFGGFVKIFGESYEEENVDGPEASRSFVNKAKWKQAIVLSAGVLANFLLAWLLFSFGFMSGLPTSVGSEIPGYSLEDVNLVVVSVANKSPAQSAGLMSGDKILYIGSGEDTLSTINPSTVKSFVVSHKGKEIEIAYTRGKSPDLKLARVTPVSNSPGGEPLIGIGMDQIGIAKLPLFTALSEGMKLTLSITKSTVLGLYTLIADGIRGRGSLSSVTGPIGLVGIAGSAYNFGFVYLLSFVALVSINLSVINLFPIPALDGGRLLFLLIEKIKRSRMNPKVANTANMIGFGFLVLLMVVITYHDVLKLF